MRGCWFMVLPLLTLGKSFSLSFEDVSAKAKPKFYISTHDDRVPFSVALYKCQEKGMRLLGSYSDGHAIFNDAYDPYLEDALGENVTAFWFVNAPLNKYDPHPSVKNDLCSKMTVEKYYTGYTIINSDQDFCSKSFRYICETSREEKQGDVYFIVSAYTTKNYQGARKACLDKGLQMAYVKNFQQNKQLTRLIRQKLDIDKGLFWVGAINLIPGSAYNTSYTDCISITRSWAPDQCTTLAFDRNNKASPCLKVNCSMQLRFICQMPVPGTDPYEEYYDNSEELNSEESQ